MNPDIDTVKMRIASTARLNTAVDSRLNLEL